MSLSSQFVHVHMGGKQDETKPCRCTVMQHARVKGVPFRQAIEARTSRAQPGSQAPRGDGKGNVDGKASDWL
jgi:hypothetical protein